MRVQFDNRLLSSLLLFVDHEIQKNGSAFANYSGQFYAIPSDVYGLSAYAAPFKPLCNDVSISGANIMSGVYVNGHFVTIGQSGLASINHDKGMVYFSGSLPNTAVVSGNYAIKEFGTFLSDQTEVKLLFETKYVTNSKFNQTLSGLPLDTKTSPAIFLLSKETENKPFGFGRLDNNSYKVRVIVIADNEFQRTAVCNILKNLNTRQFPIYSSLPFDRNGAFTGLPYNYDSIVVDSGYNPWILSAKSVAVPNGDGLPNSDKKMSMVDLEVSTVMGHF